MCLSEWISARQRLRKLEKLLLSYIYDSDEIQQILHKRRAYKRPDNERIIRAFYECKSVIADVANYLHVDRSTVYEWMREDKTKGDTTLEDALKASKPAAHDWVKGKLMSRIDGYEQRVTKYWMYKGDVVREENVLEIYPPDVPAMHLYYALEGLLIHKTENNNNNLNLDIERVIYRLPDNGRRKDRRPPEENKDV